MQKLKKVPYSKQKLFVDRVKENHPEKLTKLKNEEPIVFKVLAMFYGLAGWGAMHHCKAIAEKLREQGMQVDENMVHEIKWYGLFSLGWKPRDNKLNSKAKNVLRDIARRQQEGEIKMELQEFFNKIVAELFEKSEKDQDFGNYLKEVEKVFIKNRTDSDLESDFPQLALERIYDLTVQGNSLDKIAATIQISEEEVLQNLRIIFCFAFPKRISERGRDVQGFYLRIKGIYDKAQAEQGEADVGEEDEDV
ncbi:hypothetical protein FJ208_02385, partial [Candidatus Gribaldobacteria bacterium]|nr:hypothetical protein [Candidatus Gribaldobacteria bacterium]